MPLPRLILCLIPFGWDDEDPIFKKIGLFDHKGLQRLAERARIELKKGKGIHKFRHSGAIFLSKAGINEQIVEKLGG